MEGIGSQKEKSLYRDLTGVAQEAGELIHPSQSARGTELDSSDTERNQRILQALRIF